MIYWILIALALCTGESIGGHAAKQSARAVRGKHFSCLPPARSMRTGHVIAAAAADDDTSAVCALVLVLYADNDPMDD